MESHIWLLTLNTYSRHSTPSCVENVTTVISKPFKNELVFHCLCYRHFLLLIVFTLQFLTPWAWIYKTIIRIDLSWLGAIRAKKQYLSQYFHDHWHHSILLCEALERHVPGRPPSADEDVSIGCLKGDILHVRSHPAVGLTKHGLWSQSGSHQVDVFAFHRTVGRIVSTFDFCLKSRVSGTVVIKMRIMHAKLVYGEVSFLTRVIGSKVFSVCNLLPAIKDFGLEFRCVRFNNLHLDESVLLRPDSLQVM